MKTLSCIVIACALASSVVNAKPQQNQYLFGHQPSYYASEMDSNPDHYRVWDKEYNINVYNYDGTVVIFNKDKVLNASMVDITKVRHVAFGATGSFFPPRTGIRSGYVRANPYNRVGNFCVRQYPQLDLPEGVTPQTLFDQGPAIVCLSQYSNVTLEQAYSATFE